MSADNRDEQGRFVPAEPTPDGPDWSSLGVDFETARNAVNMQRALENVNTRPDALRSLYNPQYDSGVFVPAEVPGQDEPFAQYAPPQPDDDQQYYDPPQQPVPDFAQFASEIYAKAREGVVTWDDIQRMQLEQAREEAANQAVQATGLPAGLQNAVNYEVQQMAAQYPNRQPAEMAKEVAERYLAEIRGMQIQAATPPPGASPPSADSPIPGEAQPQSFEEAAQWMRDNMPPAP